MSVTLLAICTRKSLGTACNSKSSMSIKCPSANSSNLSRLANMDSVGGVRGTTKGEEAFKKRSWLRKFSRRSSNRTQTRAQCVLEMSGSAVAPPPDFLKRPTANRVSAKDEQHCRAASGDNPRTRPPAVILLHAVPKVRTDRLWTTRDDRIDLWRRRLYIAARL